MGLTGSTPHSSLHDGQTEFLSGGLEPCARPRKTTRPGPDTLNERRPRDTMGRPATELPGDSPGPRSGWVTSAEVAAGRARRDRRPRRGCRRRMRDVARIRRECLWPVPSVSVKRKPSRSRREASAPTSRFGGTFRAVEMPATASGTTFPRPARGRWDGPWVHASGIDVPRH